MAICNHGRAVGNCPLCPVKPPEPQPAQNFIDVGLAAPVPAPPPIAVRKADKPEVTDPTARLAQEYAQELENMAAIRAAVTNTRSLLKGLEADEADAQKRCSSVFKQLQASMTPVTRRKKKIDETRSAVASNTTG